MTRILVADDDSVMLGLLQTLLELEGYEVVSVIRHDEIIPAVERNYPDLVLMDFHLAGGNALHAIQHLRNDQHYQNLPVIVTSGMDCRLECLEAGANDFVLKPFRPSILMDTIQAALDGRQL